MGHIFRLYMKTALLILLVLSSSVVISGCWGHNELSELGLVLTTGIDRLEDGSYQMTVMAVVPAGGGGGMGQSEKSNTWIGSAVGESVMDASKNLRKTATKRLSWLQNDVIIIGEEAARDGIEGIIDFAMRNREIRLNNKLLISQGKASDIFNIPADIEKNLYTEIKGMIDNTREWSKGYAPDLNDFLGTYTSKYSGNVTGRISFITVNLKTYSTYRESAVREEPASGENKSAIIIGSAVFRKDKLIGFLSDEETRGYLWIIGKAGTGAIVASGPKGTNEMTMEVQKAQGKIKPSFEEGKPSVTVEVKLKGTLVEDTSRRNLLDKKNIESIQKQFANQIKSDMRMAVKKAQKEYKLDIFNMSTSFYRHKPSAWREMQENWEQLFPDMEVKYEVKVVISNIGEIQNRVIGGEQE